MPLRDGDVGPAVRAPSHSHWDVGGPRPVLVPEGGRGDQACIRDMFVYFIEPVSVLAGMVAYNTGYFWVSIGYH